MIFSDDQLRKNIKNDLSWLIRELATAQPARCGAMKSRLLTGRALCPLDAWLEVCAQIILD